ncbi:putative quinol monooxygenase [Mesorhizobium sp. VK4C]|uniref:putative quinol monooxygenase n=1 Tax=Mesorhizobium captivum TaxID=3072319 RepID=UPI002A23A1CD|nr:putative quinol monooxygenase [Mesorhizobium sp. VK4C]MDX8500343.1 putative quinol monooxygenase [Mesorhizobium sp. VK4C]
MAERPIERIVRIAELEIDPDRIDSFKALLAEEIEAAVRSEPGVLFLHAVAVKGAPEMVRVIECYADQSAYQAHLTTPHFLKYKTQTADMVRSLRLIETEPIALRAKGNQNSN